MEIKPYSRERDEDPLMHLFEMEGDEWIEEQSPKYRKALQATLTYVAYEGEELCGFVRSIDDAGLYIYVCDLLVTPDHRGKGIGKELLERLYKEYPDRVVYVMSDNDGYYEKLGYTREGTLFQVAKPH